MAPNLMHSRNVPLVHRPAPLWYLFLAAFLALADFSVIAWLTVTT